jgi:hypothetical protein
VRSCLAIFLLLLGSSQMVGCKSHPLLGQWAFSELEQAWEVQKEGKLTVSNVYDDKACTEGGQGASVRACHQQRKWANAGTLSLNDTQLDAYQFVIWKVTADTLNGRLDTCRCRDKPVIYYGLIEEGDLLLFDSNTEDRSLVDRGKFTGAPD